MDKEMKTQTEQLIYCFDILAEKYKIDIQEMIDFKQIINDVEREISSLKLNKEVTPPDNNKNKLK